MCLRSEFHWLYPNVTTETAPVCVLVEGAGRRWETGGLWVGSPHLKSCLQLGIVIAISISTMPGISDSASQPASQTYWEQR